MKCEEFEAIRLDAGRDSTLTHLDRQAVREHAAVCSRCAAFLESWLAASAELRALGEATVGAQTPVRVEERVLHSFRAQQRAVRVRRTTAIAGWALAAAAILLGAVGLNYWRAAKNPHTSGQPAISAQSTTSDAPPTLSNDGEMLMADNDLSDFTLLPTSVSAVDEDADIVRVRMQRGGLGALGLPVNEEQAADWIQVDLLVGSDGVPQAVRLPQE
jgi:hypothetical protein